MENLLNSLPYSEFEPILGIEGYSKNYLKKIRNLFYSCGVSNFNINSNTIYIEIKIGSLILSDIIVINGEYNIIRKKFQSLNELRKRLKNNHSLRYFKYNLNGKFYEFDKNYNLYFYKSQLDTFVISPMYDFNTNENHTKIVNEDDFINIICKNAKFVGNEKIQILSEDFCKIPKGVLLSDLKKASSKIITNFKKDRYFSTATIFKAFDYPYKIFNEIDVYDTLDVIEIEKLMFLKKLTSEQKSFFKVKYNANFRNIDINPSKYQVERDLKENVYDLENFKKRYLITEELVNEFIKIYK